MKNEVYIIQKNYDGVNFDNFSHDTEQDEYLIKLLVDYLEEQNIEIFEMRFNVAATETGWYGAFYKDTFETYDKDTDIIGKFIDGINLP